MAPTVVGVRAETQVGWRAGVLGSSVVEFGRIQGAVELGILEEGGWVAVCGFRRMEGDFWGSFGCGMDH